MKHADTRFGLCAGCEKWVPRDSMQGINITVFGSGAFERREVIQIRMCPPCMASHLERCTTVDGRSARWSGKIMTGAQIAMDPKAAEQCDIIEHDDSQIAAMAASTSSEGMYGA